MTLARVAAAAAVVALAVMCAPAALVPGFNGADLIVLAAPVALLAICVERAPQTPAGGSNTPTSDVPHITDPPAGTDH